MGRIIASCGHEITWEWFVNKRAAVALRDYSRDGSRTVSYGVYCPECRDWASKKRITMARKSTIDKWLSQGRGPHSTDEREP